MNYYGGMGNKKPLARYPACQEYLDPHSNTLNTLNCLANILYASRWLQLLLCTAVASKLTAPSSSPLAVPPKPL